VRGEEKRRRKGKEKKEGESKTHQSCRSAIFSASPVRGDFSMAESGSTTTKSSYSLRELLFTVTCFASIAGVSAKAATIVKPPIVLYAFIGSLVVSIVGQLIGYLIGRFLFRSSFFVWETLGPFLPGSVFLGWFLLRRDMPKSSTWNAIGEPLLTSYFLVAMFACRSIFGRRFQSFQRPMAGAVLAGTLGFGTYVFLTSQQFRE